MTCLSYWISGYPCDNWFSSCRLKFPFECHLICMTIFYDLNLVEAHLPSQHRDFAKCIRRWRDAHSISSDLSIAADLLEQALRLSLAQGGKADLTLMALMHAAVMGYSRALERKSNHRGKIAILGRLTPEQIAMHKKLVHLRDESIGHHGPAGTYKVWHEDRALLIQDGLTWQPAIASRMALFDKNFAVIFHAHLSELRPIVEQIVEERRGEFQRMLDERAVLDEVADVIERSALAPDQARPFVGPLLSGPRKGRTVAIWKDQ